MSKFDDIIAEKAKSAKYMTQGITDVIQKCGKRDPGSQGEKEACEYMAQQLRDLGADAKVESFELQPGSFFGWIYYTATLALLGVGFYFVSPILSLICMAIGFALMFGQFIFYRKMVDFLFRTKTSHNVTAIKPCTGEVKRRIFINGHPDAAFEWPVNYRFGGTGFLMHFVLAVGGAIYYIILAIVSLAISGGFIIVPTGVMFWLGIGGLIFVPFIVLMYWLWNENRIVDGANDNLTACYLGIAVLHAMKEHGIELEHTEVGVLLSGSEEAGLRGAKAWAKQHAEDYKDVETVIYSFDTIREKEFLQVNDRDLNNTVKADIPANDLFVKAGQEVGVEVKRGTVPFGATDCAAFTQGGFRSAGITALDHNLRDYYHTRRDTYDNMNEECLADCFAVMVKTVELFDKGELDK